MTEPQPLDPRWLSGADAIIVEEPVAGSGKREAMIPNFETERTAAAPEIATCWIWHGAVASEVPARLDVERVRERPEF